MVGHAPSEGTKVTLGENAPITREGTGYIANDSLAAESLASGGEFSSNRTTSTTTTENITSTEPHETPAEIAANASRGVHGEEQQGQAAPSYVNVPAAIAQAETGRPHGKNLKEEDESMTGRPAKFNVEVGSKEDPSREALQTMLLEQTKGAPGTGPRQVGERDRDEQPFVALDRETSA